MATCPKYDKIHNFLTWTVDQQQQHQRLSLQTSSTSLNLTYQWLYSQLIEAQHVGREGCFPILCGASILREVALQTLPQEWTGLDNSPGYLETEGYSDQSRVWEESVSLKMRVDFAASSMLNTPWNSNVHDPRALAVILEKAEANLEAMKHPDPYTRT